MGQCVSRKAGAVVAASGHHNSPSYRIMDKAQKQAAVFGRRSPRDVYVSGGSASFPSRVKRPLHTTVVRARVSMNDVDKEVRSIISIAWVLLPLPSTRRRLCPRRYREAQRPIRVISKTEITKIL